MAGPDVPQLTQEQGVTSSELAVTWQRVRGGGGALLRRRQYWLSPSPPEGQPRHMWPPGQDLSRRWGSLMWGRMSGLFGSWTHSW